MFKKILIAMMILVLALLVVACGGETAKETEAPATEHVHVYEENTVAPTCTTPGKVTMECECGDIQGDVFEIPVSDHVASAIDCEQDTVCTVCGEILEAKKGHFVASTTVVTPATCGTAGKEKGSCENCGKVIETEVPATGHVPAADAAITISGGSFATSCANCGQSVTLTAQAPAFQLTFEGDIAAESANDIGLALYQPESWTVTEVNGSKAFTPGAGKPFYINIVDPDKLAALGTFVISFDYTTTAEAAAGTMGSIFSLLNNHFNGVQTSAGTTGWGWVVKYIEDADKLATVNNAGKLSGSNSVDLPHNTKCTIQIVISPAEKATHTFVNGTYIGTSGQAATVSELAPANASFRFGDGPVLGHAIDNVTICALK